MNEIKKWIVECKIPHIYADKLLKIFNYRLLPNLPQSTKTLLKKDLVIEKSDMATCSSDKKFGKFAYLGIKAKLSTQINSALHESNTLELVFNIDGFLPFKASKTIVWLILCKILNDEDLYKPFTVAVYSDYGKSKFVNDYLEKFVKELNELFSDGLHVQDKFYTVQVKFFTCDTPARSYLKYIVGHTSFHACERCKVIGKKVDHVTVFLDTKAVKKTDESFRTFRDPEHHKDVSILSFTNPPLNLVNQFILDPMHLLYL